MLEKLKGCTVRAHQKNVGFGWSLFLIGHMYCEWYITRLLVNNKHQTYTASDEIGLLAQSRDTVLDLVVNTIYLSIYSGGVYLIKRNKIFTLISCKFCILDLNLKLEVSLCDSQLLFG